MLSHFLRASAGNQSGGGLTFVNSMRSNRFGTTSSISIAFDFAVQTNDIVIVGFSTASNTNRDLIVNGSDGNPYNELADLYANDTYDTNLFVGYKIMGATVDTGIILPNGTFSSTDGGAVTIQVWRGVNTSNPIDVTTTTATGTNGNTTTPPAITPITTGAIIICVGASASNKGVGTYSSSQLDNFRTAYGSDTYDALLGMGSYEWTGGTFTPNTFTCSIATATDQSSASATLALRPA
jgi:hypothetical protein